MKPGINLGCLAVAGFAAVLPACGSQYADYCQKTNACEGGNDKDQNACADQLQEGESVAGDYGCSDDWKTYWNCLDTNSTCLNKNMDSTACTNQYAAVAACIKANSGR